MKARLAGLLFALVLPLLATPTEALTLQEIGKKIFALEQEIDGLKTKLSDRKKEHDTAKKNKSRIIHEFNNLKRQLVRLKQNLEFEKTKVGTWPLKDVPAARRKVEDKEREIEKKEEELDKAEEAIRDAFRDYDLQRLVVERKKRELRELQQQQSDLRREKKEGSERERVCKAIVADFRARKHKLISESKKETEDFRVIAAMGYEFFQRTMFAKAETAGCKKTAHWAALVRERDSGYDALAKLLKPICEESGKKSVRQGLPRGRQRNALRALLGRSYDSLETSSRDGRQDTDFKDTICEKYRFAKKKDDDDRPSDKGRKAYLNCVCNCLAPSGGRFSCKYDTKDPGWSPSCRRLSDGPCICKAGGCFRGKLPAGGKCVEACKTKNAASQRPRPIYRPPEASVPTPTERTRPAAPERCLPGQTCFKW